MLVLCKRLWSVLLCLILVSATLLGCGKTPDNPKELLAKVYKDMAEVSSFNMKSKLMMDTSMSSIASNVQVNTEVGMTKDPFELTVVQEYCNDGEEPVTNYMYTRQAKTLERFLYKNGQWNKTEVDLKQLEELKKEYSGPIDFSLYFNEVDSFTITSTDAKEIVIEGTVSGSNMVNVLKETGVLKQLSLSSFPEKQLEGAKPIKVKAWISKKSQCFTKISVDMAATYQDLTNLLFGENSTVNPKINQCIVELYDICINQQYSIVMPEDIKSSLNQQL